MMREHFVPVQDPLDTFGFDFGRSKVQDSVSICVDRCPSRVIPGDVKDLAKNFHIVVVGKLQCIFQSPFHFGVQYTGLHFRNLVVVVSG